MALIYVVDDEETVRKVLRKVLELDQHEVRVFGDGREAISALESERPDILITDLFMPEMDGIELLTHLGDQLPSLPIIVLSGGGGYASLEFVLEDAAQLGATTSITKPISVARVRAAVDLALSSRGRRPREEQ